MKIITRCKGNMERPMVFVRLKGEKNNVFNPENLLKKFYGFCMIESKIVLWKKYKAIWQWDPSSRLLPSEIDDGVPFAWWQRRPLGSVNFF